MIVSSHPLKCGHLCCVEEPSSSLSKIHMESVGIFYRVVEENMLEMKYDSIVDYFQVMDKVCSISDHRRKRRFCTSLDSYRAYRDQTGELESVVLVYSFNVQQTYGLRTTILLQMVNPVKRSGSSSRSTKINRPFQMKKSSLPMRWALRPWVTLDKLRY